MAAATLELIMPYLLLRGKYLYYEGIVLSLNYWKKYYKELLNDLIFLYTVESAQNR